MNIEFSLRGLLNTFFRHFGKIFIISALIISLGFIYVQRIEKTYDATATLLIKFGKNAILDVNRKGAEPYSMADSKPIMLSYIKILQSRDLLMPAIYKIGVEKLYPSSLDKKEKDISEEKSDPVDNAINRLVGHDLEIAADTKSNIISIRVLNKNPNIAAKFTDILIQLFIAHQNKIYGASGSDFLDKQIEKVGGDLIKARTQFLNFKEFVSIYNLDREMELLLSEKSDLSTIAYSAISRAQEELAELKAQEAEMLATYQKSSPILKSLQYRISVIEEVVVDRQYDISSEGEGDGTLVLKLANIDKRIAYLEKHRPKYEQHAQIIAAYEDDYNYFKQRGGDAQINDMLQQQNITHISVIEHPVVAVKPIPTKKKLLFIAFILLGVGLGLGVALFLEILDDRIMSAEVAAKILDLPVLESFNKKERAV